MKNNQAAAASSTKSTPVVKQLKGAAAKAKAEEVVAKVIKGQVAKKATAEVPAPVAKVKANKKPQMQDAPSNAKRVVPNKATAASLLGSDKPKAKAAVVVAPAKPAKKGKKVDWFAGEDGVRKTQKEVVYDMSKLGYDAKQIAEETEISLNNVRWYWCKMKLSKPKAAKK